MIKEPPARPRRSLAALEDLRQRLRTLFLADGASSVALGLAVACVISFLCDYFLHLPAGVRVVFLFAGIVALIRFVRRRILEPLARTVEDEDLAKLVERSHPEFKESLLTAVELTREPNENAAHVSPALLRRVVESVEERTSTISFSKILDRRPLYRKVLLLGGVVVLVLAGGITSLQGATLFSTWFRRNVLLSAQEWPKRTEIELVSPRGNPIIIALGDTLDVDVRLVKGSSQVFIEAVFEGQSVHRDVMAEVGGGVYRRVFPNVARPFEFKVEAGDDQSEQIRVEVRLRPRIDMASIRLWCTYPAYTGWDDTPVDGPLRYGNLKVPVGTNVRYEMAANVPIRSAKFFFEPSRRAEGAAGRVTAQASQDEPTTESGSTETTATAPPFETMLTVTEERQFAGEFVVEESGRYYFELETSDGFPSRKPDQFRVEAVPDRKPLVRILEPARVTEEVSPTATVVVRVAASDDYGLAEGSIFGLYFPPDSDEGEARSFPLENLSTSVGSRERDNVAGNGMRTDRGGRPAASDSLTLEIAQLVADGGEPPQPNARFQFRAQVVDSSGNLGESEVHQLNVVDVDNLLRILSDRLLVARDQLREVVRRQQSLRKDLTQFQQKALLAEKIDDSKAARLMRYRQDQHRITKALDRETQEMGRVLGKIVANDVGDEKWRKWVEALRRDLENFAHVKSPAIEDKLKALEQAVAQEPQDAAELNPVTREQRQLERDLEALVMRLSEFGDFNALVELMREVRRRQAAVRDATQTSAGGTEKKP